MIMKFKRLAALLTALILAVTMLAACRDSNVIQVYKRNEVTGLLEDTHQDIVVDMPVCVQFVSSVNNL